MAEVAEGWGVIRPGDRRAHYYRDMMALCRRVVFYNGPLEPDRHRPRQPRRLRGVQEGAAAREDEGGSRRSSGWCVVTSPAGRHAQPRERPLTRAYLNTRWRATDVAADVRWYAAKATRALKRAAVRLRRRDDDNDVPRPGHGAQGEPATGCGEPDETAAPGHFGRPHISGSVHDEPVWYQPHAAPDIPQGFWSPPALRDWLPELLEWALTAPIGEIRAAA